MLRFRRNGAERVVSITPEPGCRSRVQIIPGKKRNASADGFYVQLTNVMIAEAADDNELAFIIAHEMAHNILGHQAQLDRTGRSAKAVRASESEADRLGIRLMHDAYFDPYAAARFWARFGAKTGHGILSDRSHLRTKPRVALLEAAARETGASPAQ
jgi:beta-barrel assembly-enhancing protease